MISREAFAFFLLPVWFPITADDDDDDDRAEDLDEDEEEDEDAEFPIFRLGRLLPDIIKSNYEFIKDYVSRYAVARPTHDDHLSRWRKKKITVPLPLPPVPLRAHVSYIVKRYCMRLCTVIHTSQ